MAAPAEEAPSQHPTSSTRRDRTADDVVVGHRDNPADECIERPQQEESARDPNARMIAGSREQDRDQGKATRPPEGAHDVERHAALGPLRKEADNKLRQQPAEAQHRARRAHRVSAAGQMIDEAGHDRGGIDRRRAGLKGSTGAGNLPEDGTIGAILGGPRDIRQGFRRGHRLAAPRYALGGYRRRFSKGTAGRVRPSERRSKYG